MLLYHNANVMQSIADNVSHGGFRGSSALLGFRSDGMSSCPNESSGGKKKNLHLNWEISPSRLQICTHADGSDFKLGSGGYGTVSCFLMYVHVKHVCENYALNAVSNSP